MTFSNTLDGLRRTWAELHQAHPITPDELERARTSVRMEPCDCQSPVCPKDHMSAARIRRRLDGIAR